MYTLLSIKDLARTRTIAHRANYEPVSYGTYRAQQNPQQSQQYTRGVEVTIGKQKVACHYGGGAYPYEIFTWYIGLNLVSETDVQNLINRHTWIPPEAGYDLSTPFNPY